MPIDPNASIPRLPNLFKYDENEPNDTNKCSNGCNNEVIVVVEDRSSLTPSRPSMNEMNKRVSVCPETPDYPKKEKSEKLEKKILRPEEEVMKLADRLRPPSQINISLCNYVSRPRPGVTRPRNANKDVNNIMKHLGASTEKKKIEPPRKPKPNSQIIGISRVSLNMATPRPMNKDGKIDVYKSILPSPVKFIEEEKPVDIPRVAPVGRTGLVALAAKRFSNEATNNNVIENVPLEPVAKLQRGVGELTKKVVKRSITNKDTSTINIKKAKTHLEVQPDSSCIVNKRLEASSKYPTWLAPEIRALKRAVSRPDLNPKFSDYWLSISRIINAVGVGKSKRVAKSEQDCLMKWTELSSEEEFNVGVKAKIKAKAKAKGKVKNEKTMTQKLKSSNKMYELKKAMTEQAFGGTSNLKIINPQRLVTNMAKNTYIGGTHVNFDPAENDDDIDDKGGGEGPMIQGSSIFNTPVEHVSHSQMSQGMRSARSSVDWGFLGDLDVCAPTPLKMPAFESTEKPVDEVYKDINEFRAKDVRDIMNMKKKLKQGFVKGSISSPSNQFDKKNSKKLANHIQVKEKAMTIMVLIEEYENLKEVYLVERDEELEIELLVVAEQVYEAYIATGKALGYLISFDTLEEADRVVKDIRGKVKK